MVEFNLEEHFLYKPPKEYPISPEAAVLRDFFIKRHITKYKIAETLGFYQNDIGVWFMGKRAIPTKHRVKLEALRNMFLEWEKAHGYMFNSEEHLAIVNKPKPPPPTPKKIPIELPKFKYVPLHDCPYKKDGLNFGLDYNEYDVCDDCHLSVACLRYKKRYESWRKKKTKMNCPYCDAKMTHVLESGSAKIPIYECGSHYDLQVYYRTDKCFENEIDNQMRENAYEQSHV